MKFNIQKLRKDLITKRVIELNMPLREAAEKIGISSATLSRIENGKTPEVDTFCNLCTWLETKPNDYFIIPVKREDGIK